MNLKINLALLALLTGNSAVFAFTTPSRKVAFKSVASSSTADDLSDAIERSTDYLAGAAGTKFAKTYGSQAGKKLKTVGEAFATFTDILGQPINALYKNMMSDFVGTTHLTCSDARFVRDPIWSLGIITALETLLRNYPEKGMGNKMISAVLSSNELDEAAIRAEADAVRGWAEGKSPAEVAAALKGDGAGDGPIFEAGKLCRDNEFFKYSKYYGVGLATVMAIVGIEDGDNYKTMEEWVGDCLDIPFYTACNDSDLWFRTRAKLELMETMMKEIEIREKKKMAERLEEQAEWALMKAKEEADWQKDVERAEAAQSEIQKKKDLEKEKELEKEIELKKERELKRQRELEKKDE